MRGSKDTMVRSQNKGRSLGEKREERREKREEREARTITISRSMDVIGRNGSIPEGRDGREKGRPRRKKGKSAEAGWCRKGEENFSICAAHFLDECKYRW